jgi:hypothetical protein
MNGLHPGDPRAARSLHELEHGDHHRLRHPSGRELLPVLWIIGPDTTCRAVAHDRDRLAVGQRDRTAGASRRRQVHVKDAHPGGGDGRPDKQPEGVGRVHRHGLARGVAGNPPRDRPLGRYELGEIDGSPWRTLVRRRFSKIVAIPDNKRVLARERQIDTHCCAERLGMRC